MKLNASHLKGKAKESFYSEHGIMPLLLSYDDKTICGIRKKGLRTPTYRDLFPTPKRWEYDYLMPTMKVIIEIQGWGRHQKYLPYAEDCLKNRLSQLNGYYWFSYTYAQVKDNHIESDLKMLAGGKI